MRGDAAATAERILGNVALHTNAYNYFDGYEGLIYAAYDRVLVRYGLAVVEGLDQVEDGGRYFTLFIENIITFALKS